MPKMKTHKGAASRIHITGSGKYMRTKVGKSHFRRNKSRQAKGQFDETLNVSKKDVGRLKRLLPYGLPK